MGTRFKKPYTIYRRMSRYNFRKRKEYPEDLSKFIASKRRRIDKEDVKDTDEVVLYDEEPDPDWSDKKKEVVYSEEEIKASDSISERGDGESDEGSEKGSGREDDGEVSDDAPDEGSEDGSGGDAMEEEQESFDLAETMDNLTREANKHMSRKIDYEDIEAFAERYEDDAERERTIEELKSLAERIKKELEDEEPTIVKILSTPMTWKDRKKMVQLYEIYKNTIEDTPDHLELRNRIIHLLKSHSSTEVEESERIEAEIDRITKDAPRTDTNDIRKRIISLQTTDMVKARLLGMYRELEETPTDTAQYRNLKEKLEWCVSLPYEKVSSNKIPSTAAEINGYCREIRKKLDSEIYGMEDVKEEMIAMLVNQLKTPGARSSLALEGPPGVGKTAICAAFAKAAGKPFERIALGGLQDPYLLKGSDNHFVGSGPSLILSFLRNMKIADGYILLDEIDKLGDQRGQAVQDALLHITDYTQNKEFRDTFLSDFPHDISKICFLYGMNDRNKINPILRDRLNIVEVEAYTPSQIKQIIKFFVLPKALREFELSDQVSIDDGGCDAVMERSSNSSHDIGVRKIEEAIRKIVLRINLMRHTVLEDGSLGDLKLKYSVKNFKLPFVITRDAVRDLLSSPKNKTPTYII